MPVTSTHPQYDEHLHKWLLVRDVVNSDVKKHIKSVDINDPDRNARYRDDARLTNFTSRTKHGLVGSVFRKPIEMDLPEAVEYLIEDATGNNTSIEKLAQETVGEVLQAGRYGLLVDFPASEEGLTAAEVENMNLKARISPYRAENIINWQTTVINGTHTLTLVVLSEIVSTLSDDGFQWKASTQYRVLRLVNGTYIQQVYDQEGEIILEYTPRDFNGAAWDVIPFVFVGSEDNDAMVDVAPLYDLAELNIGHLRNSADYEESVHVTGQPTLIISTEMSAEEFTNSNPNGVMIGARRGHNLGPGGSAILLQAAPNQLADIAMQRKEEQAVMIGARLVMQAGSNETAEAARIKHSGENSVLALITSNVNDAILRCIQWVKRFMTADDSLDDVVFTINREFFDVTADPQTIMAQLQLFNSGIIATADVRGTLRKTGLIAADRTDEDIDGEVGDINPLGTPDFEV